MKLFFITMLFFTITMHSQTTNYIENHDNFTNPERGLYKYTITRSSEPDIPGDPPPPLTEYNPVTVSDLMGYKANGMALVLRIFSLERFVNTDAIAQDYKDKMIIDFGNMRTAGVKCILRFSYSDSENRTYSPVRDATKARLLGHITQLAAITSQYQDIISSVEAGFIGVYGEWALSDYYGDSSLAGGLSEDNLKDRKEIGNAIMTLAPSRMVAFRTPRYQRLMLGLGTPTVITSIPTIVAYAPRIAAHNDCFLSSASNAGTYGTGGQTEAQDRAFVENQSKITFDGGESCNNNTNYTNGVNAIAELSRFHFNYLNSGYFGAVVNPLPALPNDPPAGIWVNTTTPAITGSANYLEEIRKKLGYRFRLISSTLAPNTVTVNLKNIGYGNVFNPRKSYLVLKNTTGTVVAKVEMAGITGTDVRAWNAATTTVPAPVISWMKNLTGYVCPGAYNLFLEIPDSDRTTDSKYSIRLANNDYGSVPFWDATLGFNNLNRTITINSLPTPIISGSVAACTEAPVTRQTINSTALLPGQTASWSISLGAGTLTSSSTGGISTATINWTQLPGTITLTLTLPGGCTVVKTQTIESICGCSCLNNIGFGQAVNVKGGSNVVAIAPSPTTSETCDEVINYVWNWGDGTATTNTTGTVAGTHCYAVGGNYTVTVMASLYNGCSQPYTFNANSPGPCQSGGGGGGNSRLSHAPLNDKIQITPNPSKGIFNLTIDNFDGKLTIQVLDMNGRIVYQAIDQHFNDEKEIDLNACQSGIYILKVDGENINYSQKIIKN